MKHSSNTRVTVSAQDAVDALSDGLDRLESLVSEQAAELGRLRERIARLEGRTERMPWFAKRGGHC